MKKTTLLIADIHRLVRDGLSNSFLMEKNYSVIAQAGSGRDAVEQAIAHTPDVIIMDTNMPDINAMDATRQIHSNLPGIKIIALSTFSDESYIMGMLDAGVSGYVLKSCPFKELLKAVEVVSDDMVYLCPDVTGQVVKTALTHVPPKGNHPAALLSRREREVLQLIAEGHKAKEIAAQLFISAKTVQIHRSSLKKKLNLTSTAALTRFAVSNGITSLEFIHRSSQDKSPRK